MYWKLVYLLEIVMKFYMFKFSFEYIYNIKYYKRKELFIYIEFFEV